MYSLYVREVLYEYGGDFQ